MSFSEQFMGDASTRKDDGLELASRAGRVADQSPTKTMREEFEKWWCGLLAADELIAPPVKNSCFHAWQAATTVERKQNDDAYGYASRLFKYLAPQCEPLSTLPGILTQLDNYITGQRKRSEKLEAALSDLVGNYSEMTSQNSFENRVFNGRVARARQALREYGEDV